MSGPREGSVGKVRNALRRKVEQDRIAHARMERLLGVEGDEDALYREVARVVAERDALRRRREPGGAAADTGGSSLEAVVLYLDGDGIEHLSPHGRETVRAPWDPDLDPHEVIVDAVAELGLAPTMVHSTSWRVVRGLIVLTFLVVVEPPARVPDTYEVELVTRAELARGRATGPPPQVHLSQVVEHGLRHLAWLVREDEAILEALRDWPLVLSAYVPEPFRAFGREPGA